MVVLFEDLRCSSFLQNPIQIHCNSNFSQKSKKECIIICREWITLGGFLTLTCDTSLVLAAKTIPLQGTGCPTLLQHAQLENYQKFQHA